MFEWKVERVYEGALEKALNKFSDEGYHIEKLEFTPSPYVKDTGLRKEWTIVATKLEQVPEMLSEELEIDRSL